MAPITRKRGTGSIIGRTANGWWFWTYRKGKEWVRLRELRK